jgi:hypothetical protein
MPAPDLHGTKCVSADNQAGGIMKIIRIVLLIANGGWLLFLDFALLLQGRRVLRGASMFVSVGPWRCKDAVNICSAE